MNKTNMITCLFVLVTSAVLAQEREENRNVLKISGYAEIYYAQDFNKPPEHNRPPFIYSHNRTNEINVNLAYLKAAYQQERVRGNLALATGTYMNANYAAEAGVMQHIYEANIGIKVSKKHNLWLDAGIMPSHLGFESALGADNWTLTRSLMAENSPYFEAGVKLSYSSPDERWAGSLLLLNGWQRIQRVVGNSTPAFGHQLTFKPSSKWTINSGSFVGNDQPDSSRQFRYFHNLYAIWQVNQRFGITSGVDVGIEQRSKGSAKYNRWMTAALIGRYQCSEILSVAGRVEYYQDKNGVIIPSATPGGFDTWGFSVNMDYRITERVIWRTELRNLRSKDALFENSNADPKRHNTMAITALTLRF